MVRFIFGGQVFCRLLNRSIMSKDVLNSEPPLCNPDLATPLKSPKQGEIKLMTS